MTKVLEGKKGLIIGIANDHSIAWGIARSLHEEGASMYLTYQNDSIKKRVELHSFFDGVVLIGKIHTGTFFV